MFRSALEMEEIAYEANHGKKPNPLQHFCIGVSLLYRVIARKWKETAAVVSGRKLADNKEYEGASRVSQEAVEREPRRWIIEECVPACQILWEKNIYTFMCSDGLDSDAWIELELACLSPENQAVLDELRKEYVCYSYHEGCLNISVSGKGVKAQEELIQIALRFYMQDVPKKYATLDMESIYMTCGCYQEVENPDFIPIGAQLANMTFENWGLTIQEPFIRVVARDKIVKSDAEYIRDVGAIQDSETGIIYRNQFHYDKHINYLNYLAERKGIKSFS